MNFLTNLNTLFLKLFETEYFPCPLFLTYLFHDIVASLQDILHNPTLPSVCDAQSGSN